MSAADILLNVGLEGSFELLPPFTNTITAKARYTVRSIRTMGDIIAAGENPQELYTAAGVPEADYVQDLQKDVCIIGLQSTMGEWIYVPQSFIASLPNIEGVSYRPLAVVAALGLTPDDKDMVNILATINKLVLEQFGVETQAQIVAVGAAELVSRSEHERITAERSGRVQYSESEAAKMVRLEQQVNDLKHQNQVLSDYIKKLS